MANEHPVDGEDITISTRKLKGFMDEISHETEADIMARSDFDLKSSQWYRRRYQLEDQNPTYPFVGSSNITMPLIDLQIDKAKPPLMNLYAIDPIVSFKPQVPAQADAALSAEHVMQWLLTTRMECFEDNMEIGIDHMKQYGFVVFKTIYEYESAIVTETVTQAQLSEEDRQIVAEALTLRVQNPEAAEEVDQQLSLYVKTKFGLDPEDDVDRKAMQQILDFFSSSKDSITIKRNVVGKHQPYVYPVEPQFLYVQRGAKTIESAERVTEIKFMTENDLRIRGKNNFYDPKEVERAIRELEDKPNTGDQTTMAQTLNVERSRREGVTLESTEHDDMIQVNETFCMYDIDGDGIKERCLLIWQPDTKAVFQFVEHPYAHGQWPLVQIKNELTGDRYLDARGIPEILDHIDREITQNHRAKVNRMMIANSPTFKYRLGSNLNPNNINWIPGQFYPVMNMDDFEPVTMPNLDFSFDKEEAVLNTWVERRLGSVEAALTNPEQISEARTRAEIEAVSAIGQQSLSLSIRRWQRGMKKVYKQIWDLWMQYGPEEVFITMGPGLQKITKHQISGDMDIVPMGTIGNSNPAQEQSQAIQMFQFLSGLVMNGVTEAMPSVEINLAGALQTALAKTNLMEASRVMRQRSPEEMQQIQQQQQQQAQMMEAAKQNVPMSARDLKVANELLAKQSPNGKAQRVNSL